MANGDSADNGSVSQQEQVKRNDQEEDPNASLSSSEDSNADSDSESDSSYESSYDGEYGGGDEVRDALAYRRSPEELAQLDNTPEANFELFSDVLDSKRLKRLHEEQDQEILEDDDPFDFPKDPEDWREEDLGELWADGPSEISGTGWDPVWADEDDWEYVQNEIAAGRKPPIAPFYVPFRKYNPVIPDNHFDIKSPKAAIEELDRIEEFLQWVSYIFPDGSSYV